MAESENIIDFNDADFDENELFAISTTTFDDEDDTTTEVLVPDEINKLLEEDSQGNDNDNIYILDEISEVSIQFVRDETMDTFIIKGPSSKNEKMNCKICNKKYKLKYHFEKHISSCTKPKGKKVSI